MTEFIAGFVLGALFAVIVFAAVVAGKDGKK